MKRKNGRQRLQLMSCFKDLRMMLLSPVPLQPSFAYSASSSAGVARSWRLEEQSSFDSLQAHVIRPPCGVSERSDFRVEVPPDFRESFDLCPDALSEAKVRLAIA